MFQGTGSDVGKSLVVAGLCRALARRGHRVRPFKPQNMSNNAAVTADGGEIGRAQALQARGAGVPLSVHMNPVLLKPQSETGAQIVVQGRVWGQARAAEYQGVKPQLMPFVRESFARLKEDADFVLVEGAGSASETNLRANDIANMGFAAAENVPVVLVGDIDRGGVIASLVGTRHVLPEDDASRIVGFLVNRFRGDPALFAEGMATIAQATGWEAFGLIPFFADARRLPAEDALSLAHTATDTGMGPLRIAVPLLPHISNFDDLDPLEAEPQVALSRLRPGQPVPTDTHCVILAGSKSTMSDLRALKAEGWHHDILAHRRRGGHVLGLCGGYQMLGESVADPDGVEGLAGVEPGLSLLAVSTRLSGSKRLESVEGTTADGTPFKGYEMHMGETVGPDCARPFASIAGLPEGAVSGDGRVAGTYVHGIFSDDRQRSAWLKRLGGTASSFDYEAGVDAVLDRLADHLEAHCDVDGLIRYAR